MDLCLQSDISAFCALSTFVIAFLARKHLLITWLQSLSKVILEPKKIKVTQMVKKLSAVQETPSLVQSLDQEGPLEKAMATHSSILAKKFPWTEESGELQSLGS